MSKSSGRHQRRKSEPAARPGSRTRDRTVYLALAIVGAAIVAIAWLLSGGRHWREVVLGYLMAMAYLTNLYAFRAYRGTPLAGWQQALARLPLRCAGFGTKGGRPVEASHGAARARTMIIASIAFSVVAIVALAFLLIPDLATLRP